ncbi:tetratricopeptide repeat protein [Poriferisphaera corsica]|nr:tetratricopeptide repeat protein [Poriferisphaera corsica]
MTGCIMGSGAIRKREPRSVKSDTTLNSPLNLPMSYSAEVVIELIGVNEAYLPETALNTAIQRFVRHIPGRVKLNKGKRIYVDRDNLGRLNRDKLEAAMIKAGGEVDGVGPATILLFVVADVDGVRELSTYEPTVVTRDADGIKTGTNRVVLYAGNIQYYGRKIEYLNETEAWEYAIYKELCRGLGLPHRSNHSFANSNCTRVHCILHPTFSQQDDMYGAQVLKPGKELCTDCLAEAYYAIRTQPAQLLNPRRPVSPVDWYDRLVRANPSHPNALLMRHVALLNENKYAEAKQDIADAYANSFSDPMIMDYYAKFLSKCEDKSLRDGQKALQIALELNRQTKFRDIDFLQTLAAAHEELGNIEKAIEYYKKAKEISSEVHIKRERGPAFYHPYGIK